MATNKERSGWKRSDSGGTFGSVRVRPGALPAPVSPAYANYLSWEGGLSAVVGASSLALLPMTLAAATAGQR
jgi:hypothetical protein